MAVFVGQGMDVVVVGLPPPLPRPVEVEVDEVDEVVVVAPGVVHVLSLPRYGIGAPVTGTQVEIEVLNVQTAVVVSVVLVLPAVWHAKTVEHAVV